MHTSGEVSSAMGGRGGGEGHHVIITKPKRNSVKYLES